MFWRKKKQKETYLTSFTSNRTFPPEGLPELSFEEWKKTLGVGCLHTEHEAEEDYLLLKEKDEEDIKTEKIKKYQTSYKEKMQYGQILKFHRLC